VDEEIHASIKLLARFPGMGHQRRDVRDDRVRFWSVYSYLIAYRVDKGTLLVIRVVHGARDLRDVFGKAE
jgi:antitoxin ParD1/3/4/toxin ParE1/3/4